MTPGGRSAPGRTTTTRIVFLIASLAALGWGALAAYSSWWTSDDAFISFRYARNLVEGHGLVFNIGERVEGYTNFLWTLWAAAGLAAGRSAEGWANVSGMALYLASIVLLAVNARAVSRAAGWNGWPLPLAALGAAVCTDWAIFSVSGLETGAFTFLLLAGFMAVAWGAPRPGPLAGAGLLFGLASLTRPDGALPAAAAGVFILATASRERLKAAASYGAGFALLWVPFLVWRVRYYGDIVPNSYYAKSAGLAWYGQGLRYLQLYLERYWILLAGPALVVAGMIARRGRGGRAVRSGQDGIAGRQIALALCIAIPYAFYIVRMGGDFMFARLLVPVTPFLLLVLEAECGRWFGSRPGWVWAVAVVVVASIAATPVPVDGETWRYGIANEPRYYSKEKIDYVDHAADVLRRYFEGLPARVVFYGTEARLAYKARFAVAIEGETALTEPSVAREPIHERGRPGHEKPPSARYLILERRADLTFSKGPQEIIDLYRHIPDVRARFADDVYGQILRWNPELLGALAKRGATIPDFPKLLDSYIRGMQGMSDEAVASDYRRFRLFYFDQVRDPARQAAFERRLGPRAATAGP